MPSALRLCAECSYREYLVEHKYAARGKIGINGASNGGVLPEYHVDAFTHVLQVFSSRHASTVRPKDCWALLSLKLVSLIFSRYVMSPVAYCLVPLLTYRIPVRRLYNW